MPHELTTREKFAAERELDALARLTETIGHLRSAERELVAEERDHAPHVGIRNQYRIIAYADILTVLAEAERQIVQRLTGTPQAAA